MSHTLKTKMQFHSAHFQCKAKCSLTTMCDYESM